MISLYSAWFKSYKALKMKILCNFCSILNQFFTLKRRYHVECCLLHSDFYIRVIYNLCSFWWYQFEDKYIICEIIKCIYLDKHMLRICVRGSGCPIACAGVFISICPNCCALQIVKKCCKLLQIWYYSTRFDELIKMV